MKFAGHAAEPTFIGLWFVNFEYSRTANRIKQQTLFVKYSRFRIFAHLSMFSIFSAYACRNLLNFACLSFFTQFFSLETYLRFLVCQVMLSLLKVRLCCSKLCSVKSNRIKGNETCWSENGAKVCLVKQVCIFQFDFRHLLTEFFLVHCVLGRPSV